MTESQGIDVPIIQLRPLRDRVISKREHDRLLASIKALGLIEPLVVYPEGHDYVITDGVQRYKILVEMASRQRPASSVRTVRHSPVTGWSTGCRQSKSTG